MSTGPEGLDSNYSTPSSWLEDEEQTVTPASAVAQIILGLLIISGNSLVLLVLRKVSTLSEITRFLLGNRAVAECIFGSSCLIRGSFALSLNVDASKYCAHLCGFVTIGVVYTFGTTAVISGHMLYLAVKGVYYDLLTTSKVSIFIYTCMLLELMYAKGHIYL